MAIVHDPKLIILDEPVAGTYATPSPIEDAGDADGRSFSNYRPQFYFRASDDSSTNDEPPDPVFLVFDNDTASPEGQSAFEDLTLQRGVTNAVPSHSPEWTDLNDSDPGTTLTDAGTADSLIF